jgi:hypothetical protein
MNTIANSEAMAVWLQKGVHGLIAGSGERFDQSDRGHCAAEHTQHRGAPNLVPCRQPRELHLDDVYIVLNALEVAAGLIGLAQG